MASEAKKVVAAVTPGHEKLPKLTLYTNHGCPWAQRAHIALKALGIPFEEVIIDLTKPREPWYLKDVNPRGLVPSLAIEPENGAKYILAESLIVANFIVDLAHSLPAPYSERALGINPPPTSLERSLRRAAAAFFVDTYFSKVVPLLFKFTAPGSVTAGNPTGPEAEELAGSFVETIRKEIEPLLVDANPFFGGSSHVTIVEVLTGSFILRLFANLNAGILPTDSLKKSLKEVTPRFNAWSESILASDIVKAGVWDEQRHVTNQKARIEKAKESKA